MGDLLLLFGVRLHLVDLVLGFCLHVGRVVTGVVDQLLLRREVHDVRADRVHEILRVGGDDENVIVSREVRLKPDHRAEIQMVSRFVW